MTRWAFLAAVLWLGGLVGGCDCDCDGGQEADPVCGDGATDPGEECDDGNDVDTDGCVSGCVDARYGDGFVQEGVEACDDGNDVDTDGCVGDGQSASYGDGFVQEGVEDCDDGNDVDTDGCVGQGELAGCGDGFVQEDVEECDDVNTTAGDGCSETCMLESPEVCDAPGDEDGDGAEDCLDTDCAESPVCEVVPDQLFLIVADQLVRVDTDTAAYTEIGPTGQEIGMVLGGAWDPVGQVVHVIVFGAGYSEPSLGTVDLCTGAVTRGALFQIGETPVAFAEATGVDAAGTLFVSVSPGPGAIDYLSETVGTVEVATGAVTVLGTVSTLQNDVDAMTFDDRLLALDGDPNSGQRAIYTIDPADGSANLVASFDSPLISIAYSRWLDRMFAYRWSANRDLVEVDLSDSTLTDIGTIHTEEDFGGATLAGLFFAPTPSCP